jgi:hypothetical protein
MPLREREIVFPYEAVNTVAKYIIVLFSPVVFGHEGRLYYGYHVTGITFFLFSFANL